MLYNVCFSRKINLRNACVPTKNKIEIFSDTKSSVLGKLGRILFGALVLVAMVWVWYELEQIWVII